MFCFRSLMLSIPARCRAKRRSSGRPCDIKLRCSSAEAPPPTLPPRMSLFLTQAAETFYYTSKCVCVYKRAHFGILTHFYLILRCYSCVFIQIYAFLGRNTCILYLCSDRACVSVCLCAYACVRVSVCVSV